MAEYVAPSQWIKFFTKAGLPSNVAANYAIIFSDNRIQMDMLMDLSKEYLYDMGIRLMGDVIAILRHAKETHNQLTKEKVIGVCSEATTAPASVKKNTLATRMVGHYTRSSPTNSPATVSTDVSLKLLKSPSPVKGKTAIVSLKRKPDVPSPDMKKVRRVLPEEEGAYSIKLPSGTTERTRKILQLQQQLQQQQRLQGFKRSVFDRLGDSAVSSSTDSSNKTSTIFGRLGPLGNSDVSTSTTPREGIIIHQPLQYQGVLKREVNRRTVATGIYPINQTALPEKVKLVEGRNLANANIYVRRCPPTSVSTVSTTTKGTNLTLASRLSRALSKSSTNKNASHGIFGASGNASNVQATQNVKNRLGVLRASGVTIKDRLGGRPVKVNVMRLRSGQIGSGLAKPNITRKMKNDLAPQNVFERLGR